VILVEGLKDIATALAIGLGAIGPGIGCSHLRSGYSSHRQVRLGAKKEV